MTNINIPAVIASCDSLSHKILFLRGERREELRHGSAWIFDNCMRAFDRSVLPAEAITLSVFFGTPVMRDGEATIHRDGRMELRLV